MPHDAYGRRPRAKPRSETGLSRRALFGLGTSRWAREDIDYTRVGRRAAGLPVTVAPGETESFTVSGTYELVQTDEGDKANLHLVATGSAGGRFTLGINVHLRG